MDPNKRRKIEPGNAFAALQSLSRAGDSPSVSGQNSPARTPRTQAKREQSDELGLSRTVKYSSFQLSKHNHRIRADGVTELRLVEGDRFVVLGSLKIKVLQGEVSVAGASLRPIGGVYQIHAPHCHALPVLRIRKNSRLELYNHTTRTLRQLGRLSPLFGNIWNEHVGLQAAYGNDPTYNILCSSNDAPKKSVIQELVSPPQWNQKLASLELLDSQKPFTTLVCGPKSAGKSTFSKFLTNRLITRSPLPEPHRGVMVLDLDPGQPEYSPPGTLSLVSVLEPNLGPPFTNVNLYGRPNRIVRCHALANVTPASNTKLYQEAAYDLLETYQNLPGRPHLIINTPGWILGTGLELLEDIICKASPDEVIYMSEDGPMETVEALRAATKNTFTTLVSQPTEFGGRTGAHLRAMSTMSYFHASSDVGLGTDKWNESPLESTRPYEVAYTGENKGFKGILSYDYQPPPEGLAEAINGMILALVVVEDAKVYRQFGGSRLQRPTLLTTPEWLPYIDNPDGATLDPRYCQTIGLVLVRGIGKGVLQLLTPVPISLIQEVKSKGRDLVLVHGKFDTPDWAYKESLHYGSGPGYGEDEPADSELKMRPDATAEIMEQCATDAIDNDQEQPWIQILKGNEKRPLGSKVWRVRRDLGKNNG